MSSAETLLAPPPSRHYRWSSVVLLCAAAGLLTALPEALVLGALPSLFIGVLRWTAWGAVFAPLVYALASTPWRALFLLLPVVLVYNFAVASGDLLQPVILYTLTAGYRLLVENANRKTAAEEERREIEERFAVARLDALLGQLQPHFIFNSLNTVSALAGRDPFRAARIAEELRDLFRRSTEAGQEVALSEEIEFVSKYADVQKARFEERLKISFAADPPAMRAQVPALILQPLVENAIRHGMTTREGVSIGVSAAWIADSLRVTVVNDGCSHDGYSDDSRTQDDAGIVEGVGLSNTRARLQAMYGDRASLRASRSGDHRFVVELAIPQRS